MHNAVFLHAAAPEKYMALTGASLEDAISETQNLPVLLGVYSDDNLVLQKLQNLLTNNKFAVRLINFPLTNIYNMEKFLMRGIINRIPTGIKTITSLLINNNK